MSPKSTAPPAAKKGTAPTPTAPPSPPTSPPPAPASSPAPPPAPAATPSKSAEPPAPTAAPVGQAPAEPGARASPEEPEEGETEVDEADDEGETSAASESQEKPPVAPPAPPRTEPAPRAPGRVPLRTAHWELHPVAPPSMYVAKRIGVPGTASPRPSSPPAPPARAAPPEGPTPPSEDRAPGVFVVAPPASPENVTNDATPAAPAPAAPTGPTTGTVGDAMDAPPPQSPTTAGTLAVSLPSAGSASTDAPPPVAATADALEVLHRVQSNIGGVVIGYEGVVRALLVALVANGHILLEGVPGLAKTYLVRSFARSLALSFRRIQFTPDMLPADILGTVVLDPRTQMFEFRPGPIFANVILADEINRAPPKVQSALLEAMQERQVTVEGVSYPLPSPFVVIATENPVELEGTYPLPEAELDRFLFRILLGYPSAENELRLLKQRTVTNDPTLSEGVLGAPALLALRDQSQAIFVHDDLLRYIAALLRETRSDPRILSGASPRAGVQLLMAVKAAALFSGRHFVIPDDVKDLAFDVLNHRLVLRPEVLALQSGSGGKDDGGRTLQEVVFALINKVAVPW